MNVDTAGARALSGAADKAPSPARGLRSRTSIVLLIALLTAIVTVSALTIQLLQGQRRLLEDTIRNSQAQAMALLSNHVEQAILATLRPPFLFLKNLPADEVDAERVAQIQAAFPEVEQVLFLGPDMLLRGSFPGPRDATRRRRDAFLVQRTIQEGIAKKEQRYGLYTFVETLDGRPALFAVQRVSEVEPSAGWILMRFDLDVIQQRRLAPLLAEAGAKLGGPVQLQDADAPWDDDALNWPIGRLLPGWLLVFKASDELAADQLQGQPVLMLGVTSALILAMVMATFAVWRELRREHALVALRNRFVANVSHELKTPLALIRMYAETLYLRRVSDERRQHDYHRILLHESERLSQMINAVLDFSRLSQGIELYRLSDYDLRATVSEVLDSYRWRVEDAGLRLECELDTVPRVAHDRHGVTQMLINLIDNAVKYAADGGVVRVSLLADGDAVRLTVTDHGPGIAEAERERARRPFERGREADPASGSGLGLALVEQIARVHHARLVLGARADGPGLEAAIDFRAEKVTL